jgi:hypothetical protein
MKVGRKRDGKRDEAQKKYGLADWQRNKWSRARFEQLDACKDDSARRLLLGKGRKVAA